MTTTAAAQRLELVPVTRLVESPSNHRTRTWGDMKDLVASVKSKGVLQPILARPMAGTDLLEIVFGHRRVRAAKEARLEAVPAVVRELSDVEALEANIIENLQRADVHPMEEAEGMDELLKQKERPLTVDDLAAKVGKSKAYVYGRLKLLDLCKEAREAFYKGEVSPSVALLVARIPDQKLQREALNRLKPDPWEKSPKSFREAADIIRDGFMLRLAEAPWKLDDAALVPSAGACAGCPHTSGAQPGLFAELDKSDGNVCTNPPCFAQKKEAWQGRTLAEAKEAGREVLAGADAKRAVGRYRGDSSATHVQLDDTCYDDPKNRTYRQLLGKKAPAALAQTDDGKLVEVVEKKAARDVLKEAGHKFASEATRSRSSSYPGMELEKRKHALKRLRVRKAIALIVQAAEKRPLDESFLADAILGMSWHDTAVDICKRRELETGKGKAPEDVLAAYRKKLTAAQVRGLLVESFVTRGAYFQWSTGDGDTLKAAAKLYGVDLEKCAKEAAAEMKEKAAAKKAKGKTPAKKGGRRG